MSRVFLLVLDSFGIGEAPDAGLYNDKGSNTLRSVASSKYFNAPVLQELGLFNIDGTENFKKGVKNPNSVVARLEELSRGKDSTTGHWEMAGEILKKPFPTYEKFSDDIIEKLKKLWKVDKILCNKRYSGTEVIKDYGIEHIKTKCPIVYTSADSVLQIACHEDVYSVKQLYKMCEQAESVMMPKRKISRIIARPFIGEYPNYVRTENRKDFSIDPPNNLLLEVVKQAGYDTISIGKIKDLFNKKGIKHSYPNNGNDGEIISLFDMQSKNFNGLCWLNFCDFDSKYGHRNDIDGYAKAINVVDKALGKFIRKMRADDYLILTADHGCDPATKSTDHSREYVPFILFNKKIKYKNCGTVKGFNHVGATVLKLLSINTTNKLLNTKYALC